MLPAKRTTTTVTLHAAGHARGKIRSALHLLTWLDQQQIRLEHTSQTDLDRYLTAVSGSRQALLAAFVTWTTRRGLTPPLHIPRAPTPDPHIFLDTDKRADLLRRCLTDTTLPLPIRPSRPAPPSPAATLLFPARRPSRPANPHALARQLRAHLIPVQAGKNTARAALAEDLPAPILAELLGLHPGTAAQWSKHIARNWLPYLAERAAE